MNLYEVRKSCKEYCLCKRCQYQCYKDGDRCRARIEIGGVCNPPKMHVEDCIFFREREAK